MHFRLQACKLFCRATIRLTTLIKKLIKNYFYFIKNVDKISSHQNAGIYIIQPMWVLYPAGVFFVDDEILFAWNLVGIYLFRFLSFPMTCVCVCVCIYLCSKWEFSQSGTGARIETIKKEAKRTAEHVPTYLRSNIFEFIIFIRSKYWHYICRYILCLNVNKTFFFWATRMRQPQLKWYPCDPFQKKYEYEFNIWDNIQTTPIKAAEKYKFDM